MSKWEGVRYLSDVCGVVYKYCDPTGSIGHYMTSIPSGYFSRPKDFKLPQKLFDSPVNLLPAGLLVGSEIKTTHLECVFILVIPRGIEAYSFSTPFGQIGSLRS